MRDNTSKIYMKIITKVINYRYRKGKAPSNYRSSIRGVRVYRKLMYMKGSLPYPTRFYKIDKK